MKLFQKYKEKQYYKKRAELWKQFKKENKFKQIECGLVKETKCYTPWLWEYDCNNCSYDKDFFDKYGCMYIKGFMDY